MKIQVRMLGINLSPVPKSMDLELEPEATVETALRAVVEKSQEPMDFDRLKASVLLCNNQRARLDTPLSDGDKLLLLRTLEGG